MLWPLIAAMQPSAIPHVDPLEEGDTLPLLGGARVVHTPGHTPGSISLHFPNEGVLIVGDALQRRGNRLMLPSRFFSNDMDAARESVRKMAQLDFDTICFSHFLPMKQGARAALRSLAEYVS
jgi:glyoxylase-like metal-dependent hydrolase (beta-lactamase superfamily II)